MSLAETLERAASELSADAEAIRPANGDPFALLEGLDPEASQRVLVWLLTHEPEAGAELAAAWAELPAGTAPLQAVDEAALPKAGRKGLRRALHRLRSRGVTLEKPGRDEPVVGRLPKIEEHFEAASVSGVDPGGTLVAYLVESSDAGGARLFEALLSETRGLEDFQVYSTGRSRARNFMRQMQRQSRATAVEAEPAAVRALILAIADRQPADRTLPRTFSSWRSRLARGGESVRTPGEQVSDALEAGSEPALLREAAERVRGGAFGPWPPAIERLSEIATVLRERVEGRIVLSGSQEREKLEGAVEVAAEELFDADFAAATARRMRHSAYVRWKQGEVEDARIALAAATAFEERPAQDNPVAAAFVEVALGPLLKSLQEEQNESVESVGEGASDSPSVVGSS